MIWIESAAEIIDGTNGDWFIDERPQYNAADEFDDDTLSSEKSAVWTEHSDSGAPVAMSFLFAYPKWRHAYLRSF